LGQLGKRIQALRKGKEWTQTDLAVQLDMNRLRDKRLLEAYLEGKNDISEELVFRSPEGAILDPGNLYHRVFLPVLAKAGIRKIRLHDLRYTFGSLLLQNGASIVYVEEQMAPAQFRSR
jgi:integrase